MSALSWPFVHHGVTHTAGRGDVVAHQIQLLSSASSVIREVCENTKALKPLRPTGN